MESFFFSLKTERIAPKPTARAIRQGPDVLDYIERFYNPTRRHSTLGASQSHGLGEPDECSRTSCPSDRQQAK
jgi:transposase InsO family protein